MKTAKIKPHRRPRISPRGPAESAPKKVPADKMETTSDDVEEVMILSPVAASIEPKVSTNSFMARIPPIVPVSYPYRTPPNATKALKREDMLIEIILAYRKRFLTRTP